MGIGSRWGERRGVTKALSGQQQGLQRVSSTLYYKLERRFRSRRAGHRGLRAWIPALQSIQANHENVQKHLNAVAPHAHFRGWRMRPAHRNFHRAQAVMPRQVQKLRIKAEAFDALLLEDDAAAFVAKGLEAALRIDKRQTQNGAHDKIENDAGRLPENGLMYGNQAAVQRARTDGHVVIREGRKKFVRFVDRRRQIRVGKQHDASA